MSTIVGVIHPLPEKCLARFFESGKTIFFKPATLYRKIEPGMKFFFYRSGKDRGIVGEAIIAGFDLSDNPWGFLSMYGDKVFMTKTELCEYLLLLERKWTHETKRKVEHRKRVWIAYELSGIVKYRTPKVPRFLIPVSGRYAIADD
ncbi:MAG: DUF365 domain-containing protein [Methanomassiliicoccales archaeon]